jgi:hypothetical protein
LTKSRRRWPINEFKDEGKTKDVGKGSKRFRKTMERPHVPYTYSKKSYKFEGLHPDSKV